MKNESEKFLSAVAQVVSDKKGFNLLALDVSEFSNITDYLFIAEGNVDRHVRAMAASVIEEMKKVGIRPVRVEGLHVGDWIVIDYLHIIIHLFMPGQRDNFQLEQLWSKGRVVDLEVQQTA